MAPSVRPRQRATSSYRQLVEVAQRQRAAVVGAEVVEHPVGGEQVESDVPGVDVGHRLGVDCGHDTLVACRLPPVVDQLVAGDADEPGDGEVGDRAAGHGVDRSEERLRREVLGHRAPNRTGTAR